MDDAPRTTPLNAEEILEFSERGFLTPGRVLSNQQLESLRAVATAFRNGERATEAAGDLFHPEAGNATSAHAGEPGDANNDTSSDEVEYFFGLWTRNEEFRALSFSPVLATWAAQLIGARQVRLLEDDIISKPPGTGGRLSWHQDHSYYGFAQPNSVTMWIPLDDVSEENGTTVMAVGSHLGGERLPVNFQTGNPLPGLRRPPTVKAMEDPEAAGYVTEPVRIKAGEVSIHHSYTWHASLPNRSDRERRAILERYVADGTIWLGDVRASSLYPPEAGMDQLVGKPLAGQQFPIVAGLNA